MAYEFLNDQPPKTRITTPEFWHLTPMRICELLPGEPAFVQQKSIIEDPTNNDLGIDTDDRLMPEADADFSILDAPIGVLGIIEAGVSGYIADLRYVGVLKKRPLNFDSRPYDADDFNAQVMAEPLFGTTCIDPESSLIRLECKGDSLYWQSAAIVLMEFVDAARRKRGGVVIGAQSSLTPQFLAPFLSSQESQHD